MILHRVSVTADLSSRYTGFSEDLPHFHTVSYWLITVYLDKHSIHKASYGRNNALEAIVALALKQSHFERAEATIASPVSQYRGLRAMKKQG
jgi:hypothetical protein